MNRKLFSELQHLEATGASHLAGVPNAHRRYLERLKRRDLLIGAVGVLLIAIGGGFGLASSFFWLVLTAPGLVITAVTIKRLRIGRRETKKISDATWNRRVDIQFQEHKHVVEALRSALENNERVVLFLRGFDTHIKQNMVWQGWDVRRNEENAEYLLQNWLVESEVNSFVFGVQDSGAVIESLRSIEDQMDMDNVNDLPWEVENFDDADDLKRIYAIVATLSGGVRKIWLADHLWQRAVTEFIRSVDRIVIFMDGQSEGLEFELDELHKLEAGHKTLVVTGNRSKYDSTLRLPFHLKSGDFPFMVDCWDLIDRQNAESEAERIDASAVIKAWKKGKVKGRRRIIDYYLRRGELALPGVLDEVAKWHYMAVSHAFSRKDFSRMKHGRPPLIGAACVDLAKHAHSNGQFELAIMRYEEFERLLKAGDLVPFRPMTDQETEFMRSEINEISEEVAYLKALALAREPFSW